ncbi:hypothetical protein WN51_10054 [Melipona quadrifasciata]|uniref:Uncharacterized protein n=1 Tax=Melipona quadrifasciata TaxID=166423 RepID=A0A0M9ADV6_9HYME|nr:hypothetical protein WN51_10054 [Melipona quadrifasciata]
MRGTLDTSKKLFIYKIPRTTMLSSYSGRIHGSVLCLLFPSGRYDELEYCRAKDFELIATLNEYTCAFGISFQLVIIGRDYECIGLGVYVYELGWQGKKSEVTSEKKGKVKASVSFRSGLVSEAPALGTEICKRG